MKKLIILLVTHSLALGIGFAGGTFALPILIAPPGPTTTILEENAESSLYSGTFSRDRAGSDFLHWGEGEVSISSSAVTLMGELAPGPDYQLYLSPEYVETETEFNALKQEMVQVGPVKTFQNFSVPVPSNVNPADFTTVIVWCETFGEFITSARYQQI